jgi:plasmid stabilization system protein ParE
MARDHLKSAINDTRKRWGAKQARDYNAAFLAGLDFLANNHHRLRSRHHEMTVDGVSYRTYKLLQRYVIYQEYGVEHLIISSISHERMNVPQRLFELAELSRVEVANLIATLQKE